MSSTRDSVFSAPGWELSEFTFDKRVSAVFEDMLKRSVPGYGTLISLIAVLAKRYAQDDSRVYDIGCSLGTASLAMAQNIKAKNCEIIAFDTSTPMIDRCSEIVKELHSSIPIHLFCDDALNVDYENCSVALLNLTLQFINREDRDFLIKKIYDSMLPNGALIIAEKVTDESDGELITELYYDYKRANSYTDTEIIEKRTALENVLVTDSEEEHINRLKNAGFKRVERWFQAFSFRGYIAWK